MPLKVSDNSNVVAKLSLRANFLRATGWPAFDVLDLCAGAGHIWTALRREVTVRKYLACDRAPRLEGTIRGEASVLAGSLDLAPFNVIDIDTYGEPWEPLLIAAERIRQETIFFLTHGQKSISVNPSKWLRTVAGLPDAWAIPLSGDLVSYLSARALSAIWNHARVIDTRRVIRPRVTYWAIRVEPRRQARRRSVAQRRASAASTS